MDTNGAVVDAEEEPQESGRRNRSLGKGTETPLATLRSSVDDLPGSPVHVQIVDDQPGVNPKSADSEEPFTGRRKRTQCG